MQNLKYFQVLLLHSSKDKNSKSKTPQITSFTDVDPCEFKLCPYEAKILKYQKSDYL